MNAHTKQKVLSFLQSGGILSQLNGVEVAGTTCAKDYVRFLKKDGIQIKSEWTTNPNTKKRYKIHFLPKPQTDLFV